MSPDGRPPARERYRAPKNGQPMASGSLDTQNSLTLTTKHPYQLTTLLRSCAEGNRFIIIALRDYD